MAQPVVIETVTPPRCVLCREHRRATWNGRLPDAASRAGKPGIEADYYVLVRGTQGRFRHLCRRCQKQTGDTIVARFIAPQGA